MKDRMKMLKSFHALMDASIIIISYLVAYYVRFYTPLFGEVSGNFYPLGSYAGLLLYLVPIYLLTYFSFRLYTPEPEEYRWHPVVKLVPANVVGIILFFALLYFQKEHNISRRFLLLFLIINIVLSVGSRILITNSAKLKLKRG